MNGNKPKLELEVNIPQKIKLLQDKPATGQSQYGTWYLYNVLCNNQEYSFFAPDPVVKFIDDNHLAKGSEVVITKRFVKNGNKKVTDFDISLPRNDDAQLNGSVNIQNGDVKESPEFCKMFQSMNEALQIKERLGDGIDASKVGITLFITKMKSAG